MNELPHHLKQDIEDADLSVEETPREIEPHSALVRLSMNPAAIPHATLAHVELEQAIFSEFRGHYDRSTVSLPQAAEPNGALSPSNSELIRYQISHDNLVSFEGGYAQYGDDTVSISTLGFGSQTILAHVNGTTRQAEHICKKLAELLWHTVGIERKWSEISRFTMMATHQTSTVVDLGFPQLEFYSKGFREFLLNEIEGAGGLGQHLGMIGARSANWRDDVMVKAAFRNVLVDLSIIDVASGDHETSVLEIIPDTRADINRNRVKVMSELPFDLHVEMVNNLIKRLRD